MGLPRLGFAYVSMVVIAQALTPASGHAQSVRGVVSDPAGNPLAGVVVLLTDSAGNVAARALSGDEGRFRIASGKPGRYVLVTRRIGYRPATSAVFVLPPGTDLEKSLVVSAVRTVLDTVQVRAQSSCEAGHDLDGTAFMVWDQARTALTAAQLTTAARGVRATTLTYQRSLDPVRQRVVSQKQTIRTDYVTQPWLAATPRDLHTKGFVFRHEDGSSTFYAPSLDVLLSAEFLADHCFRVAERGADDLTLRFEPTSERRGMAEIRGDIIVSRSTGALRTVSFDYTGLRTEEAGFGGGRLDLAQMKNGGWTVSRWEVRMPAIEQIERPRSLGGSTIRVGSIEANGGELVLATVARGSQSAPRDTVWSRAPSTLVGIVTDSASGRPLAGAQLEVIGTGKATTTNARGEFIFDSLLVGNYVLSARTTTLERAGIAVRQSVDFTDPKARIAVRLQTVEQLRLALCGNASQRDNAGVITGQVLHGGDSLGIAGAEVQVNWTESGLRDEHGIAANARPVRVVGRSDVDGRFRICNVPLNGAWISASAGNEMSGEQAVTFAGERLARIDISIDRPLAGRARLIARIVTADSSRTPISGVEVALIDLARNYSTNGLGLIDAVGLSGGAHRVVIRRLGYTPLDTVVSLRESGINDFTFELDRAQTLDSMVVEASRLDPALRSFEENRRLGIGHFVTRQRLSELKAQPLRRALSEIQGVNFVYGHGSRAWVVSTRQPPALCGRVAPGGSSDCHRSHGIYDPSAEEAAQGMSASCYAKVYVDGLLMNRGTPTPPFDASSMLTDQVEAIEYYASASEVPLQFAGVNTDCGVLVIHGRRA